MNYQRFQKIAWPEAAFSGFYETGKQILQMQYQSARQLLGLSPNPDQLPPTVQDAFQKLASPAMDQPDATRRTTSPPTRQSSRGSDAAPSKEKNLGNMEAFPIAGDSATVRRFMGTFMNRWRGFKVDAPRGSVVLSGLISVIGDKGRMNLLVTAFWDPKSEQFLAMAAHVVSLQPKHQRPKGGV